MKIGFDLHLVKFTLAVPAVAEDFFLYVVRMRFLSGTSIRGLPLPPSVIKMLILGSWLRLSCGWRQDTRRTD